MGHGLYVCLTASINMQERVDALAAGEGDGSNSSSSSDDESSSSSSSHFGLQSSAAPKAKPKAKKPKAAGKGADKPSAEVAPPVPPVALKTIATDNSEPSSALPTPAPSSRSEKSEKLSEKAQQMLSSLELLTPATIWQTGVAKSKSIEQTLNKAMELISRLDGQSEAGLQEANAKLGAEADRVSKTFDLVHEIKDAKSALGKSLIDNKDRLMAMVGPMKPEDINIVLIDIAKQLVEAPLVNKC